MQGPGVQSVVRELDPTCGNKDLVQPKNQGFGFLKEFFLKEFLSKTLGGYFRRNQSVNRWSDLAHLLTLPNKWQEWLVPVLYDMALKCEAEFQPWGMIIQFSSHHQIHHGSSHVFNYMLDLLPHTEYCIKKCMYIVLFHLILKLYIVGLIIYNLYMRTLRPQFSLNSALNLSL